MNLRTVISAAKLAAFLGVASVGAFFGYRYIRADVAARIYERRLADLAQDYKQLADVYNEAVRRSAVTELLVKGDTLSVRIRTVEGPTRVIPTPFDPTGEIYVDFVVVEGRLWIRRLFDARTAPGEGLVIDPGLADVAWKKDDAPTGDRPVATVGKAVYRALSEGTWIVSVSGDGSLGLSKLEPGQEPRLVARPQIKDYEQIRAEATEQATSLTASEVWSEIRRPD
jgi:hypothetical protein